MKINAILLLIIIGVILPNDLYSKNRTIIEYYNTIPIEMLNGRRYKIIKKNNSYFTQSIVEYELPVTVDIKNGYLFLEDPGTGGGFTRHELAIFVDNNKQKYLAINIVDGDGVKIFGNCRIYKIDKNLYIDITKKVIPQIKLENFLKKPIDLSYLDNHFGGDYYSFVFILPRYGTTIIVELQYRDIDYYSEQGNDDKNLQSKCKEFIENIKFKKAELIWDMNNGIFTIGKMVK